MSEKLELRKRIKSKKPNFIRQDAHKKVKLGQKWRKARGSDNKVRIGFKSYRKKVNIGYGSPREVKDLDASGLMPVVICNKGDLSKVQEKNGIVFSSNLGMKKRIDLVKKALELKLNVLNIKDPENFIKSHEEKIAKKKEKKVKSLKKKEEKKKDLEKKAKEQSEDKEKNEGKLNDEELAEKIKLEETKNRKDKEKILRTKK
ncbi:MAG: eL32 family ribosomal protein [Nanoarchaeota archaeon]|nr:eL32 family ribosomal protein [Nanoarchaeota archaeon]